MLLSGSSSTGAAGYMQTIFRVQSAGSIDGMQKKVCYAFDFAPDRTLKVLSEVHSLKKAAVGTDDDGRVRLGEFLELLPCPCRRRYRYGVLRCTEDDAAAQTSYS